MNSVADNYKAILEEIENSAQKCGRDPSEIALVAVSKGHSLDHILPAYQLGCKKFGENRIQEALEKIEKAPSDIQWHFIGTLQLNKVRKAIGKFAMIHSVDTPDLAKKIAHYSQELGLVTPILLQVNTSSEKSKHGLSPEDWKKSLEEIFELPGIRIEGLMTMAPFIEDEILIRRCFSRLREFRDELNQVAHNQFFLKHLSMGMSHDFHLGIEEGATLLRIGTAIFGPPKD